MVPILAKLPISSPKSCAFPADAMFKKSITFVRPEGVLAPTMIVLVCESQQFVLLYSCVRSPKNVAFPSDAIVIKSIILEELASEPPQKTPLVLLPPPP